MENTKPLSVPERMINLLQASLGAFNEIRHKTLVYSTYRDTDKLADAIHFLLKEVKKTYGGSDLVLTGKDEVIEEVKN